MTIAMKIRPTAGRTISRTMAAAMTLMTAAATCQAEATTKPADPNTFVSKKDGFSITVPAGWESYEDLPRVAVVFAEPMKDLSDNLRENVRIYVEKVASGMDLDAYVKTNPDVLPKTGKDFKVISTTRVKLGDLVAHQAVVQYKQGSQNLRTLSYLLVSSGRKYAIVCTSTVDQYQSHEKVFDDICKTFKTFEAALPKLQQFRSEKDGFNITAPGTWERRDDFKNIAVMFKEPLADASESLSVDVVVEVLPTRMTLEEYVKANRTITQQVLTGFKLVASTNVKLGKNDACRIVYQYDIEGKNLKDLRFLVVSGGRGYSLTCTTTVDQYASHEKIFEDICKTFQTFEISKANAGHFTSEKDGFSITVPDTWEKAMDVKGIAAFFKEPFAGPSDTSRENIIVIADAFSASITLDDFAKVGLADLSGLKEFKVVSSDSTRLGKNDARRIVYQHEMDGKNHKALLYLVVFGRRAYSITCTSSPDQYPSHEKIFEDICKTFETFAPGKANSNEAEKPESTTSPAPTTIP
jgi:hypothetical protein